MGDTPINVAYPSAEDLRLRIAPGACRFDARPGDGELWLTALRSLRFQAPSGPLLISEKVGTRRGPALALGPSLWLMARETPTPRRSTPTP